MDERDPLEGKTLAAHKTEWFLCGMACAFFIWLYLSDIGWTTSVFTSPRFLIIGGILLAVAFVRGLLGRRK